MPKKAYCAIALQPKASGKWEDSFIVQQLLGPLGFDDFFFFSFSFSFFLSLTQLNAHAIYALW